MRVAEFHDLLLYANRKQQHFYSSCCTDTTHSKTSTHTHTHTHPCVFGGVGLIRCFPAGQQLRSLLLVCRAPVVAVSAWRTFTFGLGLEFNLKVDQMLESWWKFPPPPPCYCFPACYCLKLMWRKHHRSRDVRGDTLREHRDAASPPAEMRPVNELLSKKGEKLLINMHQHAVLLYNVQTWRFILDTINVATNRSDCNHLNTNQKFTTQILKVRRLNSLLLDITFLYIFTRCNSKYKWIIFRVNIFVNKWSVTFNNMNIFFCCILQLP